MMLRATRPLLGFALLLSGCGPITTVAPIPCDDDGACPGGMVCAADRICVPPKSEPIPTCAENSDCDADAACLEGVCAVIGECVRDEHCGCGAPKCSDHVCVGDPVCTSGSGDGVAEKCAINAECPSKFYCVGGICQFAPECRDHADCPAGYGCFLSVCWPL